MTYPIIERTYFKEQQVAYRFAESINKLHYHIVSDYGFDAEHKDEPYFVETMNDPFSTRDALLKRAGII